MFRTGPIESYSVLSSVKRYRIMRRMESNHESNGVQSILSGDEF